MVRVHGAHGSMPDVDRFKLERVANSETLTALKEEVRQVRLKHEIADYIVDIVRATREHPALIAGASPRAINMIATASRAYAGLSGRDFVIPDDVKTLILLPLTTAWFSGRPRISTERRLPVLRDIIQAIPVPRDHPNARSVSAYSLGLLPAIAINMSSLSDVAWSLWTTLLAVISGLHLLELTPLTSARCVFKSTLPALYLGDEGEVRFAFNLSGLKRALPGELSRAWRC